MKYLTIEQRESLQTGLEERSAVLRGEIDEALREAGALPAARIENHYQAPGDAALADVQATLDIAEVERDIRELEHTHDALQRLHGAHYGVCEDCDDDIAYTRLSAVPTARRCTGCETAKERTTAASATRNTL